MAGVFRNVFWILLIASTIYQVSATNSSMYIIENRALENASLGGMRFEQELGNETILAVMSNATEFILNAFSLSPRKQIDNVTLFIEDIDGIAFSQSGNIHLSARYVEKYTPGNTTALRTEITGVLYHEMTHVWQKSADSVPEGVIEGIADFIRLRSGHQAAHWTRQAGGTWDAGYATSAFFFDWIDTTKTSDFVNKLNQKIGEAGWDINFFVQLTGEDVDSLWEEYQSSMVPGTNTTMYSVENLLGNGSLGGARFDQELGNDTILSVMSNATDFIVNALSLSPRKQIDHVTLFIDGYDGVAYTKGAEIHLSAGYVEKYMPGNSTALREEITGVLYHEMTHVWQKSADSVPGGVIEGIADFIRLRSGHQAAHWTRQAGGTWDAGYATSAFFFDWIDTTKTSDFVNKLNQKIGEAAWDINLFAQLTGEDVDSLWAEYQTSL